MILAYLLSALIGIVVYVSCGRLSLYYRLGISIGAFLILAILLTFLLGRVKDYGSHDAIVIEPDKEQQGGGPERKASD